MSNLVVAITGASGSAYSIRLLEVLLAAGHSVNVTISPSGAHVLRHELGLSIDLDNFNTSQLIAGVDDPAANAQLSTLVRDQSGMASSIFSESDITSAQLLYHHYADFTAGIASGSYLTDGMVICPCSMGTLASIANGLSSNLIHRAADVHLKEQRKLIVMPRETPLGSIQLENMKRLADAGAVVLPASPGFYHDPRTIHDLIDFVVARICDQLGIQHSLMKRWGSE